MAGIWNNVFGGLYALGFWFAIRHTENNFKVSVLFTLLFFTPRENITLRCTNITCMHHQIKVCIYEFICLFLSFGITRTKSAALFSAATALLAALEKRWKSAVKWGAVLPANFGCYCSAWQRSCSKKQRLSSALQTRKKNWFRAVKTALAQRFGSLAQRCC